MPSTTHLDLKRYGCPVCPKRFTELAKKKRHVRDEHPRPVKQ